ncbi:MAG: PDZ domain-containing protein [bacterium]|nr:PDZ domain-containing protein [bacterium]
MTIKIIRLVISCFFLTICLAISQAEAVVEISTLQDGTVRFEARDSSLEEIAKKLYDKYAIEVKKKKKREGEKFTFSFFADSPEEILKRLLRFVGIRNYAFEFSDATLKRLVVVPEGSKDTSSVIEQERTQEARNPETFVTIAQIQSIVAGSQAESAGLQEGDIVLEYDGVPIRSAQQLVSEVEKKTTNSQVELVVLRRKITTRLILSGGFIGVRIMTQKIPSTEYEKYQGTD